MGVEAYQAQQPVASAHQPADPGFSHAHIRQELPAVRLRELGDLRFDLRRNGNDPVFAHPPGNGIHQIIALCSPLADVGRIQNGLEREHLMLLEQFDVDGRQIGGGEQRPVVENRLGPAQRLQFGALAGRRVGLHNLCEVRQ